jgi:hypothetical protein
MRLEILPLVLGALIGVVGLLLVWDAWAPDDLIPSERRSRPRLERDRPGETFVGLGAVAMAAAFIGRDTWRWDTVAVIVGALLLLIGALRNRRYLRQLFSRPARKPPIVAAEPPATPVPSIITPRQLNDLPRRIR